MDQGNDEKGKLVSRRSLIESAVLAGGAAALATGCGLSSPGGSPSSETMGTTIVASSTNAVVETRAGKVRGFTRNGIQTFLGVPYGATTEGKARFQRASRPVPWTGIRNTMHYGNICPQELRFSRDDEGAFFWQGQGGGAERYGEDCLRLNVWSPGLDSKKRPVMLWLHGGRFQWLSGQGQSIYGENLARRGDVVVMTLNHRIGVLGFLDVSEHGPQYAESANIGMLDIVTALEWVRDDIVNFGGDPGNVLIFGQSGGGTKVTTLMSMPSAKGLFHRAVVESGALTFAAVPGESSRWAAEVMVELGLGKSQISKLHEVPVDNLVAAGVTTLPKLPPLKGRRWGRGSLPMPTADGRVLPAAPFNPVAPEFSADVPMIIGTTLNDNPAGTAFHGEDMTEDELKKSVTATHGAMVGQIIEACRKVYPNVKPIEVYSILAAIDIFRAASHEEAERKAALGRAPAYLYQFNWKSPTLDGRPRAFHCLEIPFVFYNTDLWAQATGGGPKPRALAAKISDAWINFARKGDPNHPGLPRWPKYDAVNRPVMLFDETCEVKPDPEKELRAVILAAHAAREKTS